jgi:adenine phosphoribosyltransferase
MDLKQYIREFPDYPKPGILFKDISPVLAAPEAMQYVVDQTCDHFKGHEIDLVAGAESRGLIFAGAIAAKLNTGLLMVRKKGKLPGPTIEFAYSLEYGEAVMEVQSDAIKPGQNVLLIDDLLATGGTANAAEELVTNLGGNIVGHAFVIELTALNGRQKLNHDHNIFTLVEYDC